MEPITIPDLSTRRFGFTVERLMDYPPVSFTMRGRKSLMIEYLDQKMMENR